jgi:hypothetical protein
MWAVSHFWNDVILFSWTPWVLIIRLGIIKGITFIKNK